MTQRRHRLVGLGVLFGGLVAAGAGAEPSSEAKPKVSPIQAAQAAPEKVTAKDEKAGTKDGKVGAKDEKSAPADRARDGSPAKGHRMRSGDMPGSAERADDGPGASDAPRGVPAHGMRKSAMRALRDGIKDGSIKKEELKVKLEELRQSEQQRRRAHQELVRQRWGSALSLAPAQDELRQHGRRSALLDRALVVAQTEAKPSDQERLVQRIEMLIDKENARHERAMTRLSSMRTAPTGAGAPVGSGTNAAPSQGGVQ